MQETKSIGPFGNNLNGRKRFMSELLEAGKDGWVLPEATFNATAKLQWGTRLRVFLVKESVDVTTDEVESPEDKTAVIEDGILSSAKLKKDDLLWFAKERGILVPEDIKLPLQIRKYLKEELESKSSED